MNEHRGRIDRIAEWQSDLTEIRRDIHAHPELGFEENRTSDIVAEKLASYGCEVHRGLGKTGVVGTLRVGNSTRSVGLRADMDALPILEQTGAAYASTVPGKMHACGHDGHTAILLGAAKHLAETRAFDGTVALIFQPSEEVGGGGLAMVKDGMMERFGINEVYGLHNMPGIPVGEFALCPGPMMGSADEFTLTVTGKGGHAAVPHQAIDTTLVACHIVVALQSIASRNVDPLESVVVTVGSFTTDSTASNVIAHTVVMKGTVRTLSENARDLAEARVKAIARATAEAYGAQAEVAYWRDCPVTVNSVAETEFAARAAETVAGRVNRHMRPVMGSEDFSFMLQARPGAYIFVGNGDSEMCHHPAYDFNDDAIPAGCSFFVTLIEQRLPIGA